MVKVAALVFDKMFKANPSVSEKEKLYVIIGAIITLVFTVVFSIYF